MTTLETATTTPRRAALIAGTGYAIIFLLALFANFLVIEGLVEAGDPAATAANITESQGLFRAGLVAFTVVFVLDVVIAWALYLVFRGHDRDLSLLTAWLRLAYTVMLGVALVFFFIALHLLSGADFLGVFDAGEVDAHALLALDAFEYAWIIGLAAFGIHVVLLGVLILRSGMASRALGAVLVVAGSAYALDTLARAVLADYADVEGLFLAIVAVPAIVAEAWFTLWLLLRAHKEQPAPA